MGIYLNDAELAVLDRIEDCLVKTYVFIRTRMDRRTGRVGTVSGISYQAIAEHSEYEVSKGAGVQVVRLGKTPLEAQEVARRRVKRLVKSGLLVSIGGPVLCFLCAMADYGQVRQNETNRERTTPLSTERTTSDYGAMPCYDWDALDFVDERTTPKNHQNGPNAPHIRDQGVYTSQSSSTTGREVAPGDDAPGGLYRDRPSGSQAGSLWRPGNPHEASYRDRPAASHPAPSRRLVAGADADGALNAGLEPTSARSSAEKESLADGTASPDTIAGYLRAVLAARGVRVGAVDPVVASWVAAGVAPDELADAIDRARDARLKAGSTQPIPLAYVAKVIASQRAAAKRAVERLEGRAPRAARGGVSDLEALAVQLGISGSRPGEETPEFRARVLAALRRSQGAEDGQA